jgi:hypothetical protein
VKEVSALALFNRLVVTLLALATLALAVAVLAVPQVLLAGVEAGLSAFGAIPASSLVAGGAALAALALLVLLLELRPGNRRGFVARVEGGTVEYPAATVADIVERELAGVEGVRQAQADVTGHRHKVDVRARLRVAPERDPQEVVARATGRVRERLERGLGLALGRVRLAIEPTEGARPAEPGRTQPAVDARASNTPAAP